MCVKDSENKDKALQSLSTQMKTQFPAFSFHRLLNLAQCFSDINFWHYMSEHEALWKA